MVVILLLLALWIGLTIVGFAVKAVLWLAFLGIGLFVLTAIVGVIHAVRTK